MNTVVIVGGGPAGCATALALHARGVRGIVVVEAGAYERERIGESVPPDFGKLLGRLGLLDAFIAEGHEPCVGSSACWGGDAPGYNDFIVNPHGHGWHLDRCVFERFLAREVRARGIDLMTSARFREVERRDDGTWDIVIERQAEGPSRLQAQWLVDAGGVQALLAARLGARKRIDDQLVAVSAFVALPENRAPLHTMTLLEAVEYGWWYASRLPRGRLIVAVASDASTIKAMRLNGPQAWAAALMRTLHLGAALRGIDLPPAQTKTWLAASAMLEPCAGPGWLAVGDAASCYDPISAQGIYKAFANASAAADAIAQGAGNGGQATEPYAAMVRREYDQYLRQRRYFYALERRWPQAEFWRARQRA